MRVRTDENVQITSRTTTIINKAFGATAPSGMAMTKENNNTQAIPTRAMVGKVIGGLRGGARRAALGDISNAGTQPKVHLSAARPRINGDSLSVPKLWKFPNGSRWERSINNMLIITIIAILQTPWTTLKTLKSLLLIPLKNHPTV